jgi:hypothetical protein
MPALLGITLGIKLERSSNELIFTLDFVYEQGQEPSLAEGI